MDTTLRDVGMFQVSHFYLQLKNLLDLIPQQFARLGGLRQLLTQLGHLIFQIGNPGLDLCFGVHILSSISHVREPTELVVSGIRIRGHVTQIRSSA